MSTLVDADSVMEIAQAVFSAMIDGDEGLLQPADDATPAWGAPLTAWVDLHGPIPGRASVTTEEQTAYDLTRALLDLPHDEPVSDADLIDAFGEIANVVGGNVKALLPEQGTLGLPQVSHSSRTADPVPSQELHLVWRGRPLVLAVWVEEPEGVLS